MKTDMKRIAWLLSIFLLGFVVSNASAQEAFAFARWDTVAVAIAPADSVGLPVALANPWTGGLTAPQFSSADLNFDGVNDLFVFDRGGDRALPFLADPDATDNDGAPVYRYAPALRASFPASLRNWALLADANCDGRADLFTNFQSGVQLWYDTGSEWGAGVQPSFSEPALNERANWDFGTLPMVCLSTDIPAIVDYDGDGDLDLITWTETSSTLYCYAGRGAEVGTSGCGDTLVWDVINRCYGMLNEASETNQLFIGDEHECSFNVANPRALHAGGTTAATDLDGDGHLDLLLGDVSYNSLIAAYMLEAVDGQDSTASQSAAFPADLSDAPTVDVQRFPAAFPLDVDHDGDRDILVCPNAEFEVDGVNGASWFRNEGSDASPDWALVRKDFLHHSMIDVGRGAYPAFTDFNADGLLDIVVANKERYYGPGNTPASLHRFENVGSAEAPAFLRIDTNWLDLSTFGIESAIPCFGDLDGDGDDDLLIGDELGKVYLFDNTALPGFPAAYQLVEAPIEDSDGVSMDVGQFASPSLIDLDGDGDLDLVVGEKNGNLNAYENTGSPVAYNFTLLTDALGDVHADNVLGINGFATICWHQTDTARWLLLGNELGRIQRFEMPDVLEFGAADPETAWPESHDDWGALREGGFAAPAVADLDNDGVHDLLVGFRAGGLVLWRGGDFSTGLAELAWPPDGQDNFGGWIPAPNPVRAGAQLTLRWSSNARPAPADFQRIRWVDIAGRVVRANAATQNANAATQNANAAAPEQTGTAALQLIVPNLSPGLYALQVGAQTLRIWIH